MVAGFMSELRMLGPLPKASYIHQDIHKKLA